MNGRRVLAIARKEMLHIVRDPRSLGMAVVIPLMLLILFGAALTLDVDRVPLAVWDRNGTPQSRDFIARFSASRYFSIVSTPRGYPKIERDLDARRTLAALVVPADFGARLDAGDRVPVQLIVDGSDANTATIALGYARALTFEFSRQVALMEARKAGMKTVVAPVEIRPRVWFNSERESKNYIVPGLIAVIMMAIAALLTSLTVAREWERGTMEQLISTPVRGSELIVGKLIPYFVIGMLDMLLSVLLGAFAFDVPLRGSVVLLFGVAAVFLTGALSLGMTIGIVTRNQLLASQLAMILTFLPAFLLSGFMFAIGNMPKALQAFTYLVPARYFVSLLKGIYLKGIGLDILAGEAALLAVFSAAMLTLAHVLFRKKVAA